MAHKILSPVWRGLLSRDSSVAAGLLLALVAWTLSRIVSDITDHGTIEYDVSYKAVTLADGRQGGEMSVALSNLSHDITIQNLAAAINDPQGKTEFIEASAKCVYPMPTWAADGQCAPRSKSGLSFVAPWFVPGNTLSISIQYTQFADAHNLPIVRIRPGDGNARMRLVTPGIQTWLVRHELPLLSCLLVVSVALYGVCVTAGVRRS